MWATIGILILACVAALFAVDSIYQRSEVAFWKMHFKEERDLNIRLRERLKNGETIL